jgi:UPF0176 protein
MTLFCSAFYKFVSIEDPAGLRPSLLAACLDRGIKGSILLAPEGINGTISGEAESLSDFLLWLRQDRRFSDLEIKQSPASAHPFGRMKVRLKREIVTFGVPEANPARAAGIYVEPKDWNALIESPDVTLIDTRNDYEFKTGTFKGAIDPKTRSFRQFPAFVRGHLDPARHKRVATFCTGAIRCEKATSYLLQQGFKEVYHLKGGILNYLETVPEAESLWRGECFVFDERVALRHGFRPGSHGLCRSCGAPVALASGGQPEGAISCEICSTAASVSAGASS